MGESAEYEEHLEAGWYDEPPDMDDADYEEPPDGECIHGIEYWMDELCEKCEAYRSGCEYRESEGYASCSCRFGFLHIGWKPKLRDYEGKLFLASWLPFRFHPDWECSRCPEYVERCAQPDGGLCTCSK